MSPSPPLSNDPVVCIQGHRAPASESLRFRQTWMTGIVSLTSPRGSGDASPHCTKHELLSTSEESGRWTACCVSPSSPRCVLKFMNVRGQSGWSLGGGFLLWAGAPPGFRFGDQWLLFGVGRLRRGFAALPRLCIAEPEVRNRSPPVVSPQTFGPTRVASNGRSPLPAAHSRVRRRRAAPRVL
jgi:hypothetical protein